MSVGNSLRQKNGFCGFKSINLFRIILPKLSAIVRISGDSIHHFLFFPLDRVHLLDHGLGTKIFPIESLYTVPSIRAHWILSFFKSGLFAFAPHLGLEAAETVGFPINKFHELRRGQMSFPDCATSHPQGGQGSVLYSLC